MVKNRKPKSQMIWTHKKLIDRVNEIFEQYGQMTKTDLDVGHNEFGICSLDIIRKRFSSTDKFAEYAGIQFKQPNRSHCGRIGKDEPLFIKTLEQEKGRKMIPQYYVAGSFGDVYDQIANTIYELDEEHHRYQKVEDAIRDQKMINAIGCKIVRVDRNKFLNKIRNKTLGDCI